MSTAILRKSLLVLSSLLLSLSQGANIQGQGQDERHPHRGFHPGASYALSEIETISMSSGNLMLNIPLGALPPGRGGSPGFTLGLTYNSKLYDSHIDEVTSPLGVPENRNHLNASEDGGWRYTLPVWYSMRVINRNNEEPQVPCAPGVIPYEYQRNSYMWKMQIIYPDGSAHDFRPAGFADQFNDGYFNVSPNGYLFWDVLIQDESVSCAHSETLFTTGPMVYYSTDGSYTRLVVEHDSPEWTLYFPDGRRVTNEPFGLQRLIDRNNRYVDMLSILHNNHPTYKIIDEFGRYIMIEMDIVYEPYTGQFSRQDYVYVKGTGGEEMRWTVHWKQIDIFKQYKATIQAGPYERPSSYLTPFGMTFAVIDRITLPEQAGGLSYKFEYNAPDCVTNCGSLQTLSHGWGELSSVTMPSGAKASYSYALDGVSAEASSFGPTWKNVLNNKPSGKELVYRPEYDLSTPISNTPCDLAVEVCTTDIWHYGPDSLLGTNKRNISVMTGPDGGINVEGFENDWDSAYNGLTLSSTRPDGTKIENLWKQNRAPGMNGISINPFIKTVFTSIKDAAGNYVKTAIKDFDYDKNGNITRVTEYDWIPYASVPREPGTEKPTGIPAGLTPIRIASNTFYAATPNALNTTTDDGDIYHHASAPQLLNAVASTEVTDGSLQPLSRTELSYDNPQTTGNLTESRTWDSQKGPYSTQLSTSNSISIINQYDPQVLGKLIQTTDARNVRTEYSYGDINGVVDLYPTETRVAAGTAVQRRTTAEYDFHTGFVTRATDFDNDVSTATTFDVFGRPKLIKVAEGKPEETRTATEYSDIFRFVIVRSDLNTVGDGKLVSIEHYDQLGRVRLARRLEDSSTQSATDETAGIKVQTRYFVSAAHTYSLTSNPFRAATSAAAGGEATMGWTRTETDDVGRTIEVQTFGGAALPSPWGSNTTSTGTVTTAYDVNQTTVTDQALRKRRSVVDGLGRLVRVDEPDKDTGSLDDGNGVPIQSTNYVYDAVGSLRQVIQGEQQRFFMYSSLSRLIRAHNPEQNINTYLSLTDPVTGNSNWSTAYTYDNGGNLLTKKDARDITTTYAYDSLNRVRNRTYSDGTPGVTYAYDTLTNGKGRLASVTSSVSNYGYTGYDAMGRVTGASQSVGAQSYPITNLTYDLAGHLKTMTYPSGRTITNTYDTAGRLSSFAGNLGGSQRTYSTGIVYSASGGRAKEQFGTDTPLFDKSFYNSRGQLAEIRVGTTYTGPTDSGWERGAIINHYSGQCWGACEGLNMTDNNGNLRQQDHWIPDGSGGVQGLFVQSYAYDSLNRLQRVNEGSNWQQEFVYDRWGNRTIHQTNTFGLGINKKDFTVNTANNRLGVPGGQSGTMSYDAAGNLTNDTYTGIGDRVYDAENRMTKAWGGNNQWQEYSYNADGQRTRRKLDAQETWQIYGMDGELLAEYAALAAPSSPQKEYGYRNGELLVTATATSGWGAPPMLHDNPLILNQTTVQARHITELRDAINALRSHMNMSAYSWQYSVTTNDWITANPILEMRTALDQALGAPGGGYSAGLAQEQPIKAIHIQELRDRVLGAWISTGSTDIRWLVTDHLGTPRMIFDQTGSLANVSRHDYLPFGEELHAGTGGRTQTQGYSASDGVRQHFTSKERDIDTGLDFFEARYYASMQGRFTSPDEFTGGPEELYHFADDASANPTFYSDPRKPQSLNKYQYAYNNPLRWSDPDGHELDNPQKQEKPEVIVIKTVDPKIISFDVKLIDKVPNTGEVPVGGEFEIKYKYVINEPTDGSQPGDAGNIAPITLKGTFTESNQVGLVNSTTKVDKEKEAVVVEKTERFVVNERRESKPGATAAINFKVVVKDPNTGKVVERRSTEGRGDKYIPVRNVPKEPRKNRN